MFKKIIFSVLGIFVVIAAFAEPSQTVLEQRLSNEIKASENPIAITLYKPTYILPFYYTGSPDYAVYQNDTPDNQKIMNAEFKAQISFMAPVWYNPFDSAHSTVDLAYTQLNYWQVYANSQYFRETDYEPELFFQKYYKNWYLQTGVEHQSNGRGGTYERSWNRVYVGGQLSGTNWLVGARVWDPIFKSESSDIHNPQIAYYLGYDQIILSHKLGKAVFSIEAQNLESAFTRGYIEPTISYPLGHSISAYLQVFSGYGQSLIEYNHRTNSVGIGITFNNWI